MYYSLYITHTRRVIPLGVELTDDCTQIEEFLLSLLLLNTILGEKRGKKREIGGNKEKFSVSDRSSILDFIR